MLTKALEDTPEGPSEGAGTAVAAGCGDGGNVPRG